MRGQARTLPPSGSLQGEPCGPGCPLWVDRQTCLQAHYTFLFSGEAPWKVAGRSQFPPLGLESKQSETDLGSRSGSGRPAAPSPAPGMSRARQALCLSPDASSRAPAGWLCPQLFPRPWLTSPLLFTCSISEQGMIQWARCHQPKSRTHVRLPPGTCPQVLEHASSGSFQFLPPHTHSQALAPTRGPSQAGESSDFSGQPHFQRPIFGKAKEAPTVGPLACLGSHWKVLEAIKHSRWGHTQARLGKHV